MNRKKIERKSS